MKLKPKQSQLDYLWENFSKLIVPKEIIEGTLITAEEINKREEQFVSKLSIVGQKLIGSNSKGDKLTEVTLPITSDGNLILQGSESNSLVIDVSDGIISGRLKINNDPDSLISLIETEEGLKVDFNSEELKDQLALIQNVSEDIAQLKLDVKNNSDALATLNGDENTEGSVLNLINNSINSAFQWKNLN